jgi:hypothetical protein
MTQETGQRPNGTLAAILDVRPARTARRDYYEGHSRLGAAAIYTSYANVRASFSPNHQSKQRFLESGDRSRWRRARRVTVISVLESLDQDI